LITFLHTKTKIIDEHRKTCVIVGLYQVVCWTNGQLKAFRVFIQRSETL